MEQLKRWADYDVDILSACLPANLSASGFQGASRQAEPRVFTLMCAPPALL